MVTYDLLLCTSFLFRVVYHHATMITVFYVNLYCNIMLLLWTSVMRYATVVRPRPALLTLLTRSRGCWVLCLITWVTVATVVSASVVLQIGRGGDSCFDMLENHHRVEFNNQHCLRVVLFFMILTFIVVGYGGLVLYLQSVRGARNKHTSEGGVTEVVELRGGRGVCGVFRGEGGQGENKRGVDLGVRSGAGERQGVKGGSLRVRRKILAAVVVFVACFLPYHVQCAVTLLSPHGGDCEKGKT
ncbi:probable G-protein coupled receptor 82 [Oncorhynchus keta]|uniref:probable G-protein coupled receptor 82 n=1 Tax=Oncorhynchus keta TaxID=8018 RepID=UPI00227BF1C7|nr:probable G-protein coupled receptor 82 [Oncorhynchus keta]